MTEVSRGEDTTSRDDEGLYIVVVYDEGVLRYHNTVVKVAGMGSVTHFLCKDITWIDLADEFVSCVGHLLYGTKRIVSYGLLPSNLA